MPYHFIDQADLYDELPGSERDDPDDKQPLAEDEKRVTLRFKKAGWVQLNLIRLENDRSVTSLIREAINDYLLKNGRTPSA